MHIRLEASRVGENEAVWIRAVSKAEASRLASCQERGHIGYADDDVEVVVCPGLAADERIYAPATIQPDGTPA